MTEPKRSFVRDWIYEIVAALLFLFLAPLILDLIRRAFLF